MHCVVFISVVQIEQPVWIQNQSGKIIARAKEAGPLWQGNQMSEDL
jgi:hypothetical protein